MAASPLGVTADRDDMHERDRARCAVVACNKNVHPDQWIASMIDEAANIQVTNAVWWILVGLFGLIGTTLIEFGKEWIRRLTAPATITVRNKPTKAIDSPEWLNLKEAATIAYEQTQGTALAQAITGKNQPAHDKLKNYADVVFGDVLAQAKRPPSRLYERVPEEEQRSLHVRDDLSSAGDVLEPEPVLTDIRVSKVGLDAFIARNRGENIDRANGIVLLFGVGAPFDQYKSRIHFQEHLIRVGVENLSRRQLTNCEITLERITGRLSHRCPVKIKSGFVLNPGAKDYVPFVQWDEVERGPSLHEGPRGRDQGITAFFPINKLSNGMSYLDDQPYELALKATAAECDPHEVKCGLWIENGKLRLERS